MNTFEKRLSRTEIYNGKILSLYVDDVALPNGNTSVREIVEHHGGVCVAPLTDDGKLIFVKQYRYAYSRELLELPAGKLEKGESPLEAGIRELAEETGATAKEIIPLGQVYPTVAYCTEIIYLYVACGLSLAQQSLDDDEFISLEEIPLERAVELVMSGEIKDSKTQIAVLKIARMYNM